MFKVVQNPKTGKMETVEVVEKATPESLAQHHKELRDLLDGNTQFHKDPYAQPKDTTGIIVDDAQEDDENPFGWIVF